MRRNASAVITRVGWTLDTYLFMKPAISYARFSPRPNAPECDSIERQQEDIQRWAAANGYEILEEFQDRNESGSDSERPGLWDAIAALNRGQTLIVRNCNRLARDAYLALRLEDAIKEAGAFYLAIEGGALIDPNDHTATFLRTILHAFAELQRHEINARTRAAMARHQANGRRMSGELPYGKMLDWSGPTHDGSGLPAMMIDNPEERAIIEIILNLRGQHTKLREIGRILGAQGFTCRGRSWHHSTIKTILEREG